MHPLKIRLLHAALDCAEVLDQEEMKTIIRICLNEKSSSQQLVCDLNPSVRLRSILEREKIATVGELSQKTESEFDFVAPGVPRKGIRRRNCVTVAAKRCHFGFDVCKLDGGVPVSNG